jgi:hypothetical protein
MYCIQRCMHTTCTCRVYMYVCCTVYMYAYLLVHKSKMLKSNNLEDINGRFFTPILLFSSVHILWQWAWVVCSVASVNCVEQKSCTTT